MKLLHIGPGDEVIVPTITFVSTAHAVAYNLGTPIFADVRPETLEIDPEDVERKITKRTKAIIAVHYGGRPVDMDRLKEVTGNLPVVEDAAHAAGAVYRGKKCGSLGALACFSFHAVKNLAMGDGGAIVTDSKELMERAKRLRWLGIDKGTWDRTELDKSYWWEYFVDEIGLKCHMNDIAAAIGLVQLEKLDRMNERRKEIVRSYFEGLRDIEEITLPLRDDETFVSSWHLYSIQCRNRDELSVRLQGKGISTGVHYKPIHLYRCYGENPVLPVAEKIYPKLITLPMYPGLTDRDVDQIIEEIRKFYKN
jgi:perosamine synthetase